LNVIVLVGVGVVNGVCTLGVPAENELGLIIPPENELVLDLLELADDLGGVPTLNELPREL